MVKIQNLEEKFLSRVQKTETCWIWTGGKTGRSRNRNGNGYGIFCISGTTRMQAHRMSYRLFVGEIPEGLILMHTCDNPMCVNPDHLRAGTNRENIDDMIAKGRSQRGERSGVAKLNNSDVLQIRELSKNGMSYYQIAQKFNVSRCQISIIVRRKGWTHI